MAAKWTPDSWRSRPIQQQPEWTDLKALDEAEAELRKYPPLVFAGEARNLKAALAQVAGMQPLGRLGQPAEIAAMAVFLASRQAGYVTGAALQVDGGIGARLHDPR